MKALMQSNSVGGVVVIVLLALAVGVFLVANTGQAPLGWSVADWVFAMLALIVVAALLRFLVGRSR